jgi:two-component system, cell cycle response regulator DivK
MPQMNGYEFTKNIKKIKPEVKIFLMTAFEIDDKEFRKLLQSVMIDEFVQKPIPLKDFVRVVNKHIHI